MGNIKHHFPYNVSLNFLSVSHVNYISLSFLSVFKSKSSCSNEKFLYTYIFFFSVKCILTDFSFF